MTSRTPNQGKLQLEQLRRQLSDRDVELLQTLATLRIATTKQLARLMQPRHSNDLSALRQTHRALERLKGLTLTERTVRRIGGARAGSDGLLWHLSPTGWRLVSPPAETPQQRHWPYREPTILFVEHMLAATEVQVRLRERQFTGALQDVTIETEPACWRRYLGAHGAALTLKPDLAVTVVTTDGYRDAWFVEVDMATETPARVVRACRRYDDYHRSGAEQKKTGVFPAVVWVVLSEARAGQLRRYIDDARFPAGLFTVVTRDGFADLMTTGPTNATPVLDGRPVVGVRRD